MTRLEISLQVVHPRDARIKVRQVAGLVVMILAFAAGTDSVDQAQAVSYGHRSLSQPCCGGAPLRGTRASIAWTSGSAVPGQCLLFRSNAERAGNLIQTGILKCNGVDFDSNPACNGFVKYIETFDTDFLSPTCTPISSGDTANHRYTVQQTSPSTWRAFLDGVVQPGSFPMGDGELLVEGGETTPGTCVSGEPATATYGATTQWGRYNGTAWVNVMSSFIQQGCKWTVNGGATGTWSVIHAS